MASVLNCILGCVYVSALMIGSLSMHGVIPFFNTLSTDLYKNKMLSFFLDFSCLWNLFECVSSFYGFIEGLYLPSHLIWAGQERPFLFQAWFQHLQFCELITTWTQRPLAHEVPVSSSPRPAHAGFLCICTLEGLPATCGPSWVSF